MSIYHTFSALKLVPKTKFHGNELSIDGSKINVHMQHGQKVSEIYNFFRFFMRILGIFNPEKYDSIVKMCDLFQIVSCFLKLLF